MIIQSKSGSGKTCAFGVIVCESTIPGMEQIQSIVIAPSREIVNQVRRAESARGSSTSRSDLLSTFLINAAIELDMRSDTR